MITAVMLSGGIDSTAVLVHALTNTAELIHIHHVVLTNHDHREHVERKAVKDILSYCNQHYRPYTFSQTSMDYSEYKKVYPDYLIIALQAAMLARELEGDVKVAVGFLATDRDAVGCMKHQKAVAKLMYVAHRFTAKHPKIDNFELVHPLAHMNKSEAIRLLPHELAKLTWSCRAPIDSKPCNKCKTCIERKNAFATYNSPPFSL